VAAWKSASLSEKVRFRYFRSGAFRSATRHCYADVELIASLSDAAKGNTMEAGVTAWRVDADSPQIRIRVRLPQGIIHLYKALAKQRGDVEQGKGPAFLERSLKKSLSNLQLGQVLSHRAHPPRTYSLQLSEGLLQELNREADIREIKCGVLVNSLLTDWLACEAPELYSRLKTAPTLAKVHGIRRQKASPWLRTSPG
jgi:hypothetical protein